MVKTAIPRVTIKIVTMPLITKMSLPRIEATRRPPSPGYAKIASTRIAPETTVPSTIASAVTCGRSELRRP